jgi:two-component system cell cycle response regulator
MPTLVLFALALRRAARAALPIACILSVAGIVVLDAVSPLELPYALAAAAVPVVLLARRLRSRARSLDTSLRREVELAMLLVVIAFGAVLRLDEGLEGPLYPAILVSLALVAAFARPLATIVAVTLAAALELAVARLLTGELSAPRLGPHLGFMVAFACLNAAVLRTEVSRVRSLLRSRLDGELTRMRDDARSFRLLAAPTPGRDASRQDEERLARSGAQEIHEAVLFALRLLKQSLGLHTAMLLWQNDAGTHLRISELASDAPDLSEGPFGSGDGILGAALAQGTAVAVAGLKSSYRLPYYAGPCPVRSVCALPVFEHGAPRGVLVVDRVDDRVFSPHEAELLEEAGRYAVRAIQNERVFVLLERAKAEQGKLYRAVEALNSARAESEVIDAAVRSAREITSVDFAAITLFDEKAKMHEVRAVSGEGAEELAGARFRHNGGLVSMVLENRHPLPYRGEYDPAHQVIFTKRLLPPAVPSLVVLPLLVHDRPLGTLVLGSRRRAVFNDAARSTLEVLASHMAVSLSNARMLRRLEELATTDGLTGLLNKRAMLEAGEQKIVAAKRFHRKLSVLITDIDHFKKVNDTWGHDVGDVVIKGLGEILRRAKRTTDAVARFGGEEFVIVCEETDARGAMLLAERVREELGKTVFHAKPSEPGKEAPTVQVTCSVGIATFGEAGSTWEELFKAADEALYVSKRTGRNKATAWAPPAKTTDGKGKGKTAA